MPWDPSKYNKFKSARFAPFDDLIALLNVRNDIEAVDLGCGTGELTKKLADKLPGSKVLGIDSSAEMLKDSGTFLSGNLRFEQQTVQDFLAGSDNSVDLIFSNAALQWVDGHEKLFAQMISKIREGGQLLIQMPSQHHNITNRLLNDLANTETFKTAFADWNRWSPVLDIDRYAEILFENGCQSMTVYEKIYPLVLANSDAVFDWVSGTALIPYLEKLSADLKKDFIHAFKELLRKQFAGSPAFYPFKRMIIEARIRP